MNDDRKYLSRKEVFSFAVSGFGQNMIIGVVNSFMLYFYTDVFLIPSVAVTTLMFVARIWDALLTPIVGNIVDKTRTRWGKLKPYLVLTIMPLMVITILLFFAPNMTNTGKLIYAYITYLLFGLIYTFSDVPFWGLASVMTPNAIERTNFISFSRTWHFIGNGLPVALVQVFLLLFGENLKGAFLTSGIVIGVLGAALFSLAVIGTRERCVFDEKKPTIKENINYFLVNKPLQTVFIANILGFGQGLSVLASMYIATYLFGNAQYNVLVVFATGLSGYIGMLLTPKLLKKFNYVRLYRLCALVGISAFVLMFFLGYKPYFFLPCLFISGFPLGVIGNINFAMIADSIDYVEWKTGKRTEGVSISIQSLMIKLISALQVTFVALMLTLINFKQPVEEGGKIIIQAQDKEVLDKMFYFLVFTPIAGWILGLITMNFYRYVGDEKQIIQEELMKLREAKIKMQG
ncbi:MAG: MFS transporter [Christensenellales bacterium]|jgi:sugar (glycoside-pentoside-hexuronide) transporter